MVCYHALAGAVEEEKSLEALRKSQDNGEVNVWTRPPTAAENRWDYIERDREKRHRDFLEHDRGQTPMNSWGGMATSPLRCVP